MKKIIIVVIIYTMFDFVIDDISKFFTKIKNWLIDTFTIGKDDKYIYEDIWMME